MILCAAHLFAEDMGVANFPKQLQERGNIGLARQDMKVPELTRLDLN